MSYEYFILDVFTDTPFGGNPLAVFPHAHGLSTEQMQLIARELNLSETAFVFTANRENTTHCVRIFTPAMELPFAGHPTIGTAITLATLHAHEFDGPMELNFDEGIGEVPVSVWKLDDESYFAELKVSKATISMDVPSNRELAELLNIDAHDILYARVMPAIVSCGVPFMMIPVKSLQTLSRVSLSVVAWDRLMALSDAPQIYPYYVDFAKGEAHVRMFAPAFGQPEDAATGAAAAALGSYLASRINEQEVTHWVIHQGCYVGRPSILRVTIDPYNSGIGAVQLGGGAVVIGKGEIYGRWPNIKRHIENEGVEHA